MRRHMGVNFFAGAIDEEAVLEEVNIDEEVAPGAERLAGAGEDEVEDSLESVGTGAAGVVAAAADAA